ncbi:acetyltransferase [Cohnella kolymensis]|uniref:Acetyltransferase n=1 Tax=Cohnella kolymensis TaxID=1590652 RepID=A0ABR5A042_9BACL|nr:GNAT family protein [Cohnella kolymensis]KIL34410.1 acetyltransferase [Cohnella kolymensis]
MIPTLETERLILREIHREDADSIFSYFSNDNVTRHYGMKTFEKLEQAENLIDAFSKNFTEKRGIRWGIEKKDSKGLVGTIGFNLWSPAHKRAEIGYDIHPNVWRMGYTSEALQRILEYGFDKLGLTRIGAVVFIENEASNQLLLKQGFEKEGILRNYMYQNDKVYDVNIYSKMKK